MSHPLVETLRPGVAGELVEPGSPDYDLGRRVFNRSIDRRPMAILRPDGPAGVAAGLRAAREHDVPVAVRGGGHNVGGFGTCDDGLVLDMSRHRWARVDPDRRRVRVGGGTLWSTVDRASQYAGLATPGGQVSSTGVVGLTLGGGWGTLSRLRGLSCDNVVSAEVATPSGEHVVTDPEREPELFWALRGGGGNFGVVTAMELALHPLAHDVIGGFLVHRMERAPEVLDAFAEVMADAPDEISADVLFLTAPHADPFPPELRGRTVVAIFARHVGEPRRGWADLAPLRTRVVPELDLLEQMPYTRLQGMLEPPGQVCQHHYWTAGFVDRLDDDASAPVLAAAAAMPDPLCQVAVIPWSGQIVRPGHDAMAFGQRSPGWLIHLMASWEEGGPAEACVRWARAAAQGVRSVGARTAYFNFHHGAEDDRLNMFFDQHRLDRLVGVKNRFDPTNVLRFNHNVEPVPA